MRCAFHSEIESVGTCINCGKSICRDCQTNYNGKSYCKECIGEILSTGGKTRGSYPGIIHEPNWFERHLKWTLFVGTFVIDLAVSIVFLLVLFGLPDSRIVGEMGIVFFILYFVLTSIHVGWYLRKKKRSLFWIIVWFVPVGWIIILCLTNKNAPDYNERAEVDRLATQKQTQESLEQSMKTIKEKFPGRF
jgi:hypothetical protein